MKILMISDVYFPRVNGVSTSIESFRRALRRLGHQVTLICPAYTPAQEDEPDVLRIPSRGVIGDPEDRMMHYRALLARTPQLREAGFDLIHVHTPFVAHYAGVKLARHLGIPLVESYHTFFEEYLHHYVRLLPRGLLRWIARRVANRQCRAVTHLVVPSQAMRDALSRYGVDTPMSIIPTGLPLESFRQPAAHGGFFRAQHGIGPQQPLLLYVGRAAREKNIDLLIHALPGVLAQHPDALLVIAGEGPARNHLRRLINRLGLGASIKLLGYLRRDGDLQAAYRAADLFVFASRTETQGLVLLESMALATPVVALAEMGTRDVLKEGEGCLIAENSAASMAENINRLLDDLLLRQRLSAAALSYSDQWHEDVMAARLAELYHSLRG